MYDEKYEFTWIGKKDAKKEAYIKTDKVLTSRKEESVNWDKTENLYVEGDNLDVLKLLQESYLNKVKMIYIDPPYNTGKNHIYRDNFKFYGIDEKRVPKNTPKEYLLHSGWCNLMYPRLMLARNLLSDDGVIFISIDDNEVHNLRKICDEVFGEENFVCEFIRKSGVSARLDAKHISIENDYILMYAKNKSKLSLNQMALENDNTYNLRDNYFDIRGAYKLNKLDRGSISYSKSLDYAIPAPDGTLIYPGDSNKSNGWCWRWSKEKLDWGIKNGFIEIKKGKSGWSVYFKQYQFVDNSGNSISRAIPYKNFLITNYFNENGKRLLKQLFDTSSPFDYPKPLELLLLFLNIVTSKNKNDIVLDFFSGSATTAHAVMQLNAEDGGNRKFIMVQLPEPCDKKSEAFKAGYKNICEIGKERIRRAGKKIIDENPDKADSLDIGFKVFKTKKV